MPIKCTMILGDCLEVMPALPKQSGQMCFADLPYGITANTWDKQINVEEFWRSISHIRTAKCAAIFTASFQFSADLLASNRREFRYELVWRKSSITGFFTATKAPLRNHEMILVFCKTATVFFPQMVPAENPVGPAVRSTMSHSQNWVKRDKQRKPWVENGLRYPRSCFDIKSEKRQLSQHPTQKPVALLDWLIRTYSNPGDNVLDPCSGSGTTAVSAISNGRHVTCIEKDPGYFDASCERVAKHIKDNAIDAKLEIRR